MRAGNHAHGPLILRFARKDERRTRGCEAPESPRAADAEETPELSDKFSSCHCELCPPWITVATFNTFERL